MTFMKEIVSQTAEDGFGILSIKQEFSKSQIQQLLNFSKYDPKTLEFTSDATRFKDQESFDKWLKKGRFVYVLTDNPKEGDLLGVVWFGKDDMPIRNYLDNFDTKCASMFGFTFAIRTYEKARGKHLADKLISSAYETFQKTLSYQKSTSKGIWLETSMSNKSAVRAYEKFGFKIVSEIDEKGKIIMVKAPQIL